MPRDSPSPEFNRALVAEGSATITGAVPIDFDHRVSGAPAPPLSRDRMPLPGFERAWVLRARATLADAAVRELRVYLVAFAENPLLGECDARRAELPWPDSIERSVTRRRAEFLFGRFAARFALGDVSPTLTNATVDVGPQREPLWPTGAIGSVTHVARLAAAAAVPRSVWRVVGIDLERPAVGRSQRALRVHALDGAELDLLQAATPFPNEVDLDARVTQVFSAKECLYKAAFPIVGRFFSFPAARLRAYEASASHQGPQARLVLEVREDLGSSFFKGSRWPIDVWGVHGTDAMLSVLAG